MHCLSALQAENNELIPRPPDYNAYICIADTGGCRADLMLHNQTLGVNPVPILNPTLNLAATQFNVRKVRVLSSTVHCMAPHSTLQ